MEERRASNSAQPNGVHIEAWTQDALVETMASVNISSSAPPQSTVVTFAPPSSKSPRSARNTASALAIPLDGDAVATPAAAADDPAPRERIYQPKWKPRRDSQVRREALLKGKEGSRRRQKWENDRLLGNPWAEPPEPRDWEIRPTYPVHAVPYFLAPMWDGDEKRGSPAASYARRRAAREVEEGAAKQKRREGQRGGVPRELRERLRKARGAKGLLMDLEEQVRDFVRVWDEKAAQLQTGDAADGNDNAIESESDDEEIVFVGRGGAMRDVPASPTAPKPSRSDSDDWQRIEPGSPRTRARRAEEEQLRRDKLIFDSLVDDHGASFG